MRQAINAPAWRTWLLAGGLSAAMHAGLFWGVAGTSVTPQFRVAQEVSITLVQQAEQRVKAAAPAAQPTDPTPVASESRVPERVAKAPPETQPERQQVQDANPSHTPERQDSAERNEASDQQDSAGQPVPQTKQASYSADYLNNPLPHYPNAARRRGYEGQVLLNVEVLAAGTCGRIEILQGSGHEILDDAAIEAVKRWHFIPASEAGTAVDHWMHIPIRFHLSGRTNA